VYQQGEEIRDFVISTGMAGSDTLPGIFQVQAHYLNAYGSRWDLWMPHFLTIYQAPSGLENGIHGLPLLSSGVRLWADVLGRPASFGCVILDLEAAEWLYGWAEDGVVVEIQP
jgi:lipoprotein-anchoring transpeptidase ErfK/SrfK